MMRIPSFRGLGLAAALLVGTSSIALATPSGTTVTNTVDLSYETSGVPVTVDDAATTSFVVDTAVDLIVEGMDASNSVTATRNQAQAVLTFRVENLGNDTRGYDINVGRTGDIGLTYNAAGPGAPGTYFVAYGTSPTYSAGTSTVYNTAGLVNVSDLDEGEEFYVYIVANIPASVVDDQTDTFTVTATTLNAGTNVATTELTGQGVNNVDVVFADPGVNGFEADTETLVIAAPELTVTKTRIVIDENRQGTFNCVTGTADPAAAAYIPGACVQYTITVSNAAGASTAADDIVVTDVLPSDVTYATHAAGTFDSVVLSGGNTLTASEASVAPGGTVSFTIRATID
jgi:uncharacterized repeat protein (TIGR01451 family)